MRYRPSRPDYFLDRENATPMASFWSVIEPLIRLARPKSIVEIGSDQGHTTRMLSTLAHELGATMHVVDPALKVEADFGRPAMVHPVKSMDFTGGEGANVWILDGDHNYRTVRWELSSALARRAPGEPFLVLLHDVGFPSGRRDMFYDIVDVFDEEVDQGEPDVSGEGILARRNLSGSAYFRRHAGGPDNGVASAVDEFMEKHAGEFGYVELPVFFGLGILWEKVSADPALTAEIDSVEKACMRLMPILQCLEANRLRLLQTFFQQMDDQIGLAALYEATADRRIRRMRDSILTKIARKRPSDAA